MWNQGLPGAHCGQCRFSVILGDPFVVHQRLQPSLCQDASHILCSSHISSKDQGAATAPGQRPAFQHSILRRQRTDSYGPNIMPQCPNDTATLRLALSLLRLLMSAPSGSPVVTQTLKRLEALHSSRAMRAGRHS